MHPLFGICLIRLWKFDLPRRVAKDPGLSARSRRILASLPEHLLKDIGLAG